MNKDGVISKLCFVKTLEKNDTEMELINQFTQEELTKEDVYIFKVMMADNEQDDRNYMPFNRKSLDDMAERYIGKTVVKNHDASVDNQIGRIYATEVVEDTEKETDLGESHTELYAKVYMLNTESNKDFISEIKAGIKKEVSTSTMPESLVCSVCGVNQFKSYCKHYPAKEYDGKLCTMLIDGVKECYELSFVGVPAQPRAGVSKFTKLFEEIICEKEECDDLDFRIKSAQKIIEMEKMNDE